MNLETTIRIYAGGPGSGCQGPNCGHPSYGIVKNSNVFIPPPPPSARDANALDHYVVEPDGSTKRVLSHLDYFSRQSQIPYKQFLKNGGVTITVSAGGPGIVFSKKDEDTVSKVLQIAGHPEYREYGATVNYLDLKTGSLLEFHGTRVGELGREMRAWLQQKKVA